MSSCDVVIPVKDAVWWAAHCLEELFRCSSRSERGAVIVVDDGSSADSFAALEKICSRYPDVRLCRNEGRPGFGGACNFGIARSAAPYVLLLNTDCLITPGTLRKLVETCEADASIGLASPLSNNSPVLTLPLRPGRSYLDMNAMLEAATEGAPASAVALDACTVVGNCLLVSRRCWEETGEFDSSWGKGYGEETDLQMRAMEKGFRGVALINTYVYHFGGASFRSDPSLEQIRKAALALFFSKWGESYRAYAARCVGRDPVAAAARALDRAERKVTADVLFILPGISQSVGGVHVVIDLCNHLIRHGVDAKCAVLGDLSEQVLREYQEPILSGLLHFPDERSLLLDNRVAPRIVVATLFSTSVPALAYARLHKVPFINFVQGYEFYFENGTRRREVEGAYAVADEFITTSEWLCAGVKRHAPEKPVTRLPIGVNEYLFSSGGARGPEQKVRVAVVLRSAPDKGQWILQEVLHGLLADKDSTCVTVFSFGHHSIPREWLAENDFVFVRLPVDRSALARALNRCDVFVDASLHEGFGLMPLEAMACGATVVASDSGGITEFLENGVNGFLVPEVNKPEKYLAALRALLDDRELLARLQRGARKTAEQFSERTCYERYASFFRERLARPSITTERESDRPGELQLRIDAKEGFERLEFSDQMYVIRPDDWVLRSKGSDPSILLPDLEFPAGSYPVASIDIVSPRETMLQLFYPKRSTRGLRKVVMRGRSAVAKLIHPGRPVWNGAFYTEEQSVARVLQLGCNQLLIDVRSQGLAGRLRLDPGTVPGDFVLRALEIRAVDAALADQGGADQLPEHFKASKDVRLRLGPADAAAQLKPLNDIEITRAGSLVFRATGPSASVSFPPFVCPAGSVPWVWFDIESSSGSLLGISCASATNRRPASLRPLELGVQRRIKKHRDLLAVPLTPPAAGGSLRVELSLEPDDYRVHSLEIRTVR